MQVLEEAQEKFITKTEAKRKKKEMKSGIFHRKIGDDNKS